VYDPNDNLDPLERKISACRAKPEDFSMAIKAGCYAGKLMVSACFLRFNRLAFLRCGWQLS